MLIRKRYKKSILNITFTIFSIFLFGYFIILADKYSIKGNFNISKASFVFEDYKKEDGYLPLNDIIITDDYGKFTYIVQPGDTLSKIAYDFGTTVENIKKANNLKTASIKPGDKLIISEEEGFIYQLKEKIALKDFVKKYGLKTQDLMNINYIDDENMVFEKGDEIFLPITYEQAEKLGIIEKPKVVEKPKTTEKPKEVAVAKKSNQKQAIVNKQTFQQQNESYDYHGTNVIAKWYYKPSIKNGFYAGHCTRYVAIKKFPYIDKNTQSRIWGGNANEWYANAKSAGYSVGQTPKVGAIVVIKNGGRYYRGYGHVGIVQGIDTKDRKILIEDMNAYGRFVVTRRWISMDSGIIGYIYY